MTGEVLERLAELEHQQWTAWAENLMAGESLSDERLVRWKRLCATPYKFLTEAEKEQDREWAKKSLKVMREGTSFDIPVPPIPDGNRSKVEATLVRSETDPAQWHLVMVRPVIWCSCPSYKFRAPGLCKHIVEILGAAPESVG